MEIYFWFRKSSISETKGTISCVIKIDGTESQPFSTKIKTNKENWSAKDQCFVGKNSAINELVKENIKANLVLIYRQLLIKSNHKQINPDDIKKEYFESKKKVFKKTFTMVEAMEEYLNEMQKAVNNNLLSSNSYERYKQRKRVVERFLSKMRMIDLPCKKFTVDVIEELESWMLENQLKRNYISSIMVFIHSTHKIAKKKKLIKKLPLEYYKIQRAKIGIPIVVEKNELQIMFEFVFPKAQQKVVDAWLFCAETSLSFVDYNNLNNKMLTFDEENWWIAKPRNKTEELQMIPLSGRATNILSKYENNLENLPKYKHSNTRYHLNKISNILTNNFPNIDWTKVIKWHTSRRSAANQMLNDKQMNGLTIASVMGWESLKPLARYARINKKRIAKEFFV